MAKTLTLGLGSIHAEPGEIRAFLPDFVIKMSRIFSDIVLETDYGLKMGFKSPDYAKSTNIHFGTVDEVYHQDVVLVLRYPRQDFLEMMQPGSCLISMCHFPTRPLRRKFLVNHNIDAISLESIVDDNGQRLVENLKSVAWNGCEIAFQVLDKLFEGQGLASPNRSPINVTLLGSGGVGSHAVQAAIRYGDVDLWRVFAARNIPGNIVHVIDFDLTSHLNIVQDLLQNSHLLIDATQRKDPSATVIPNDFLEFLPKNAVILDLSVDPYDFLTTPNEVKAIEGIPQGNLDQYTFPPDDPAWDSLPKTIQTSKRRWVVSCYSWPGLHPKACMRLYGNQLSPLLRRLVAAGGYNAINPEGRYHERALAHGMLKNWV